MTSVLLQGGRDTRNACAQRKDHVKRQEGNQLQIKERPQEKPHLPARSSWNFFRTVRKQTSVVLQATQSAVFCYGGPSKLIHTQHPNSVKL